MIRFAVFAAQRKANPGESQNMESISYPQFEAKRSRVHVALFRNVSNASHVRSRIIAAATAEGQQGDQEREAVNFGFIEARLITSRRHLETAIYQAIMAEESGTLLTKTVHSEILYFLNPTHNISEAIKRYGVSNDTKDLIVVRIDGPDLHPSPVEPAMREVVVGQIATLDELGEVTDWAAVKKYYKLNNEVALQEVRGDPKREQSIVDIIVTSSVAMKDVMQ